VGGSPHKHHILDVVGKDRSVKLGNIGDPPGQGLEPHLQQRFPLEQNGSAPGPVDAKEYFEQGGFPLPLGPSREGSLLVSPKGKTSRSTGMGV